MALLTVQDLSDAGVAPAEAPAGGSDTFLNDRSGIFVLVKNTHGSATRTVTMASQHVGRSLAGSDAALVRVNRTIVIPAGGQMLVGPLPKGPWNDASNLVHLTYAGPDNTNLFVSVLRIAFFN